MLDGIRVVDLSSGVAGAYGAKLLALYGADVIKVEPPGGDPTRRLASADAADPDASMLFAYLNAGKRGIVLDAARAADGEQLRRLIETADLVIESDAPGDWAGRGVDLDQLRRNRPNLVVCSVTPFGQDGPRAGWKTTALTASAAGGQLMLCGEPEREPLKPAGHQAEYQAGLHVFSSSITALFAAQRSGAGDRLDISVQEVQAASLDAFGPNAIVYGGDASRSGNQANAVWGVYACADGYVGLASMARQTPSIYECIGQPGFIGDPAFANLLLYPENNELVSALISEWTSARTAREIWTESDRFRAPFSLIPTPAELLSWPPLERAEFWQWRDHPVLGRHALPSGPFAINGYRGECQRAPLLGEDTEEVLTALLAAKASPATLEGIRPLLDGLTVLDLTQVWAGPYCARFLADMGADVIHIEGPQFPDAVRGLGRPDEERGWNRAPYFNEYNRNKRGLALDLQQPEGIAAFRRLVERADVVIENWSVGVAEGLGIGYEDLRLINPRIISVQMPGFSQDGEEAGRIGFGPSIEQMGGLVALQGYEGGPPHKSGISYGDPVAGIAGAGAIALALLDRETTGVGAKVVVYQRDNVIGLVGEYMLAQSIGRPLPAHIGNHDADYVPHNVYRGLDGAPRVQLNAQGAPMAVHYDQWLAIAVDSDTAWQALVTVLGVPFLLEERFATVAGRRAAETQIDETIASWSAERGPEEAAAALQAVGVSAMPILSPLMLTEDAHLLARRFFPTVTHPDVGEHRTTRPVWRLADRPLGQMRPAPCFGQDNVAVLRDLGGYDETTIAELDAKGVLADAPR